MARRVRGITLVEVVVGLALLATTLFFVISLFAGSSLLMQHAQKKQLALRLASSHLEQLRANSLSLQPGTSALPEVTLEGVVFRGEQRIEEHPTARLWRVQCSVFWLDRQRKRQVSYACYLPRD